MIHSLNKKVLLFHYTLLKITRIQIIEHIIIYYDLNISNNDNI